LIARHRLDHFVLGAAEQIAEDASIVLLILDHQDALAHDSGSCASTRTGTVNRNVEPDPTVDSTQIRPPCSAMIRRAIERPRPVPPFLRVLELSACWNSSKMRCWSVGAMPGPVSETETVNQPSAAVASTVTSPDSVNLIALPTRFISTWVSRRSSPLPGGRSGATSVLSASCFSSASERIDDTTECTTSSIAYSPSDSTSCPAS